MFFKSQANIIEAVSILSTFSHKSITFALSKRFKSFSENHHSGQMIPQTSLLDFLVNSQYGSQFIFAIITFFQ
jgi:hypothetical protein